MTPSYRGTSHQPAEPAQQSATTRAYLRLKADILDCTHAPGSSLYEGELAAALGVSKTPVREALGMLAHEGFVQVRPRQGYRVTDITLADVQEIYYLRLLLEPAAAELAARNATPEQLERLRAAATPDDDAVGHPGRRVRHAHAFHVLLAEASGNDRLAATLTTLLEEWQRLYFVGMDVEDATDHQAHEHLELVETLEAGDGAQARQIAVKQVEGSRSSVVAAIVRTLDAPAHATTAPLHVHGHGRDQHS